MPSPSVSPAFPSCLATILYDVFNQTCCAQLLSPDDNNSST